MSIRLADVVDVVISVDTYKDTHTAAVVTAVGGIGNPPGRSMPCWLCEPVHDGQRLAAAAVGDRGHRQFGAGLARFLRAGGEQVIKLDHSETTGRLQRREDRGKHCAYRGWT